MGIKLADDGFDDGGPGGNMTSAHRHHGLVEAITDTRSTDRH